MTANAQTRRAASGLIPGASIPGVTPEGVSSSALRHNAGWSYGGTYGWITSTAPPGPSTAAWSAYEPTVSSNAWSPLSDPTRSLSASWSALSTPSF